MTQNEKDIVAGILPEREQRHLERLEKALYDKSCHNIEMAEIRSLSFHGIPDGNAVCRHTRPIIWRLLLGLLPPNRSDWTNVLKDRRSEYTGYLKDALQDDNTNNNIKDVIKKDVDRTQASILSFFAEGSEANAWMQNVLLVYAKQHPEVCYIQGMNELLAPVIFVLGNDPDRNWVQHAECDSYYCFKVLMENLKVLFVRRNPKSSRNNVMQTGMQTQLQRLSELLGRHDSELYRCLENQQIPIEFYAHRWYSSMLTSEFLLPDLLRIWDSLLSDPNRFGFLHYVCCALIISQRQVLLNAPSFDDAIKTLQNLETPPVEYVLQIAVKMRSMDRRK